MINRLKLLRTKANLTIRDLEAKTGISNSTISAMEKGKRNLNKRCAQILADYFECSVDYLLGTEALRASDNFLDSLDNLLDAFNYYEGSKDGDKATMLYFIICYFKEMTDEQLKKAHEQIKLIVAQNDFDD